ncbi:hypothetical protein, partial [Cumulibacter manganitolerans]
MPLPLPNLDDRRWADLVDEARALIPSYAPGWTDHNYSDPGITLLDVLAWATELDLYRVNRITDAYRGKFLRLVGCAPAPARPARVMLTVTSRSAAPLDLPAGVVVEATPPGGGSPIPLCTERPLSATGMRVAALQVLGAEPGTGSITDRSADLAAGRPVPAFGPDPAANAGPSSEACPALLIGLAGSGPPAAGRALSVAVQLAGDGDPEDLRDAMARADIDPHRHHGARTAWEWFDGAGWQPFTGAPVTDETRALSMSGLVTLPSPAGWAAAAVGEVLAPLYWIRCRLAAGWPDTAPLIHAIGSDAVPAVQRVPTLSPTTLGPLRGEPGETLLVGGDPLLPGDLTVSSHPPAGGPLVRWQQRPDLDAAAPSLPGFVLAADGQSLAFGDGDRGRAAPAGHVVSVEGL